jgi:hypothetical protein
LSKQKKSSQGYLQDVQAVTEDLAELLVGTEPDSRFGQLYKGIPFPITQLPDLPETLASVVVRLVGKTFDEIVEALQMPSDQINVLSAATVNQSSSELWFSHRVGRITATKVHPVYTHMATLARRPQTVVSSRLINAVLGQERKVQTAAMKHGIATESRAASHYLTIAAGNHLKFRTSKTGIVVSSTYPYLAASPDLCIEC